MHLKIMRGKKFFCAHKKKKQSEISTCANKEHMVRLFPQLDSVNRDLRVASVAFQQEGLAADHAVHQEVVFDKVQHFVRHVQRGGDALFPGSIGDTLQKQSNKVFSDPCWTTSQLQPDCSFTRNMHRKNRRSFTLPGSDVHQSTWFLQQGAAGSYSPLQAEALGPDGCRCTTAESHG